MKHSDGCAADNNIFKTFYIIEGLLVCQPRV